MRALIDNRSQHVLAVVDDSGRTTHSIPGWDTFPDTRWVDMVVEYPEDYEPEHHALLGRQSIYSYDQDEDIARQTFPDADFSPDAIRASLISRVNETAAQELHRTDWYVVRFVETGDAVPEDVQSERNSIRERVHHWKTLINRASEAELPDFKVDFNGQKQEPQDVLIAARPKGSDGAAYVTDATHPSQTGAIVRRFTYGEDA